ncbi:MAG: DUF3303 domain-containing protein [Chloroflexota bacterium]|nr:DUF3303 domain-containing protein [Chloroflexota bacterium]
MLFYCAYTWYPATRPEQVWRRVIAQDEARANQPERIRGWYDLAAGGAGFLLIETDDVRDLTAILRPYMDLMGFDVRAVSENQYERTIEEIRTALAQMPGAE